MKKPLITFIIALFVISAILPTSCGQSSKTAEQDNHEAMNHTCPMHPEVRGKAGETCPHCGMALEKMEHHDTDSAAY